MSSEKDEKWMRKHYPNQKARDAADAATDALPLSATIGEAIQVWIETYRKVGGWKR